MKTWITLFLLLSGAIGSLSLQTIQTGNLKVTVNGIRNDKGEIVFVLFNKADGFPNETSKSYKTARAKINNGMAVVSFDQLPQGQYAVGIYHDENNNGQLDETWFGMPKEGIAVSNNPNLGIFSPPNFQVAKFDFDASKNSILIKIKYL